LLKKAFSAFVIYKKTFSIIYDFLRRYLKLEMFGFDSILWKGSFTLAKTLENTS